MKELRLPGFNHERRRRPAAVVEINVVPGNGACDGGNQSARLQPLLHKLGGCSLKRLMAIIASRTTLWRVSLDHLLLRQCDMPEISYQESITGVKRLIAWQNDIFNNRGAGIAFKRP